MSVGFFEREEGSSGLYSRGSGISSRIASPERRQAVLAYSVTSSDGLSSRTEGRGEASEWQREWEGTAIRSKVTHKVGEKLARYHVPTGCWVAVLTFVGMWLQWVH